MSDDGARHFWIVRERLGSPTKEAWVLGIPARIERRKRERTQELRTGNSYREDFCLNVKRYCQPAVDQMLTTGDITSGSFVGARRNVLLNAVEIDL